MLQSLHMSSLVMVACSGMVVSRATKSGREVECSLSCDMLLAMPCDLEVQRNNRAVQQSKAFSRRDKILTDLL